MGTDKKEQIEVKVSGDSSGAESALQRSASAVAKGVADMDSSFTSLGGVFGKVSGLFAGFVASAALAGSAVGRLVEKFAASVESTRDMARSLGIATNDVAGLEAALEDVGASVGDFESAAKGLQKQLLNNEKGLRDMGLSTRDANKQLRPLTELMADGIGLLNTYKEGTDRNVASMAIFGKGIESGSRLLLLNKEVLEANKQAAAELGLEIGGNATAAWGEYDAASDRAGLTMKAFVKVVGESAIPAVTSLINLFNSVAPAAIVVIKGALGGLVTTFLALRNGIVTVWEVLNAFVISVAEPIRALVEALGQFMVGNFSAAAAQLRQVPFTITAAWKRAFAEIAAASGATHDQIARIWDVDGTGGGKGESGAVPGTKGAKTKDPKPEKLTSRMGEWEAELSERKVVYQRENDLREMSKDEELAYWSAIARMADVNSKERIELRKRTATVELEILKQQRTEQLGLTEEAIAAYQAQQLQEIEALRTEAQFKVDTQRMTQAELLALEVDLEDKRYQVVREGVLARLSVLSKDPTKNVVALQKLNDELDAVEREHAERSKGATREQHKEQLKDWRGLFDSIGQSFGSTVAGLVNRTMTLGQAVKNLFAGLLASVANFLGQMVAKRVAAWAAEKALGLAGITLDAAKAGSGAAASQASIPIIGPYLALGAMAAVFAAVSGMSSRVSARGGYDIPAGVNPVVQAHEEEMILPKKESDTIRNLGEGGGPIYISTVGGDFIHKDQLAGLLRKLNRRFEFK